ncbi:MAG: mechanosensitive ion channel family protein [Gemmatimonadaceae bacterium]
MSQILAGLDAERVRAAVLAVLPRLGAAIVVLVAFWLVLRMTVPLLRGALTRARFAPALVSMLVDGVYKGSIITISLITAASQLGLNVSAALAGLGVAGIALGFAAQETVANMIAGFLVFWDRPFKIGDFITTQDRYGRVQEITMRTTRIRTMENTFVVIPNKQIIGDLLVNHSMYGEIRINVPIGIAYKEKVAHAREVLLPAVARVAGVLTDPPPAVVASALGDSSVDLQVRVWIAEAAEERPTTFAVLEACKVALDDAGIEIPFPHLQLFVEEISERALQSLATIPRLVK